MAVCGLLRTHDALLLGGSRQLARRRIERRNLATVATGVVKFFKAEKGWGAISSDELPPGRDAWVHFSAINSPGYRALEAGEQVEFTYEAAQQDSFEYRATSVRLLG